VSSEPDVVVSCNAVHDIIFLFVFDGSKMSLLASAVLLGIMEILGDLD